MKRVVFLLLAITTILANIYFFIDKNNDLATDFMIGGQRQLVHIDVERGQEATVLEDLIPHLNQFSEEHGISIAQYAIFLNQDVNIYMTNIEGNPYLRLTEGVYPSGNLHISNRRFYPENVRQSGRFAFPVSNMDLRVYEFEQARNIGFFEVFHLIGADREIANLFLEEFSIHGSTSFTDDDFIINMVQNSSDYLINMRATPIVTTIFFSLFILFIGVCFFLLKYRKQLLLEQLWGYSQMYSYYSIPKLFLPFYVGLTVVLGAGLTSILLLGNQGNMLFVHLSRMLLANLGVAGLFYLFLVLGILLTKRFGNFAVGLKGKSFFERIQWVSFGGKALVSLMLFTLILSTVTTLGYLRREFERLAYWQQTENVYQLSVHAPAGMLYESDIEATTVTEEGEEIQSFAFGTDFAIAQEHDERMWQLLELLEESRDTFILRTMNFTRFYYDWENPEKGWHYSYENLRSYRDEAWLAQVYEFESFFSPEWFHLLVSGILDVAQRSIYLDTNYLRKNPIITTTDEDVLNMIVDSPYVRNVLLPENYRPYVEDLHKYFLYQFYLQKIEQPNMSKERLGLSLLETTKDELSVNFIYINEGQSFFTFNRLAGDEQSLIWNPIAVVHNSHIGEAPVDALFFTNESRGQALESIRPYLEEVGTNEVQSVISVFAQGNNELVQVQWEMMQQTLDLIMIITVALMLCIVLIWAYYSANVYKINLKYLFGYSYWERNQEIILSVFVANIIGAGFLFYFQGFQPMIFVLVIVLTIVDLLMIDRLGKYLVKSNVTKVLKGGEL